VDFTCTKSSVALYKLRHKDGFNWAHITVDANNEGYLSLACQSDYGNYCYIWNGAGNDWRNFLIGLNYGYFMGKTTDHHGREFDREKTLIAIKQHIIEKRREARNYCSDKLTRETIRDIWNEICDVDQGATEDTFIAGLMDTEYYEKICEYDYYSVPLLYKDHGQCRGFWDTIWMAFREVLKSEKSDQDEN
jgi:hypothetical protein